MAIGFSFCNIALRSHIDRRQTRTILKVNSLTVSIKALCKAQTDCLYFVYINVVYTDSLVTLTTEDRTSAPLRCWTLHLTEECPTGAVQGPSTPGNILTLLIL